MKIINVDINDEIIFKNVLDVDTGVITGISAYVKLPTGNYNNIILNFSFANKSLCDNFNIFASFKINNGTSIVQELEPMTIGNVTYDRTCYIPNEVFQDKCEVTLGVYGYRLNEDETLDKRFSLVPVRNFVIEGSYDPESAEGIVPTPTVFEIYFDKINKAEEDIQNMLEQGNSDIEAMLNQCETDYNTFKAEKDAEVNEFLNNAEGQFMGTVNKLESDFAETQALVGELETAVGEAEIKVDNMQTKVNEMAIEVADARKLNNYELMGVEQEDLSEYPNVDVNAQIESTSTSTVWDGYLIGKNDPAEWDFKIYSGKESHNLVTTSQPSQMQIGTYCYYNGSLSTNISNINSVLNRRSYDANYRLRLIMKASTQSAQPYFWWDLMKPCKPTFNFRASYYNVFSREILFQGSNDNSIWTTIKDLTSTATSSNVVTPDTEYRYYKLSVKLTADGTNTPDYPEINIPLMYFSNVPDVIPKYKNNFTVDNDFTLQEVKNVIVPSYDNSDYIVENTINGINCNEILKADDEFALRYNGEGWDILNVYATGTCGVPAGTGTRYVDLGVEYKCAIVTVPSAMGNNYNNTLVLIKDLAPYGYLYNYSTSDYRKVEFEGNRFALTSPNSQAIGFSYIVFK